MRKSTLIVALASSAAVVVASAGASVASGAHSNNLGHAVHMKQATHKVAHNVRPLSGRVISTPGHKYKAHSCNIDLSSLADFTDTTSVTGCSTTVNFSATMEKRSVPNSWATWGCPPATESCTPNIMYSLGATQVTVDFGKLVKWGGFEVEPDQFQAETIQVDFYRGANGTGRLVNTISLQPNGQNGALLYALHARNGFKSAVITDQAADDFAIAQIRV